MGCLITEKKEFPDDPECPPSIETFSLADPASPLDQIIEVDLDEVAMVDGGVPQNQVVFEVEVRDCNVRQELTARAWLDFVPEFGRDPAPPFSERRVPSNNTDTRPFSMVLGYGNLSGAGAGRCHKVELLVSGGFADEGTRPSRTPTVSDDLGVAVWWLAVTDDTNPTVDVSTCP